MTGWAAAMHADALTLAAPGRELKPGESVRLEVEWDDGYAYSSYTYEDPSFKIQVIIDKPDLERSEYVRTYYNDDAKAFFLELMVLGSK